jgi:HAE1 family hydrophobic/amphiphilic exporter-1
MKALEEVFAATMPTGMGYDYQGMSYQEKVAQQGVPPAVIFGLSLLLASFPALFIDLGEGLLS